MYISMALMAPDILIPRWDMASTSPYFAPFYHVKAHVISSKIVTCVSMSAVVHVAYSYGLGQRMLSSRVADKSIARGHGRGLRKKYHTLQA